MEQTANFSCSSTPAVPTSVSPAGEIVFGMVPHSDLHVKSAIIEEQETIATELAVALEPPLWHGSQISPDGNWIAYVSNETGKPNICKIVSRNKGGKWQASTLPGMQPIWHPSENILFYGCKMFSNTRSPSRWVIDR